MIFCFPTCKVEDAEAQPAGISSFLPQKEVREQVQSTSVPKATAMGSHLNWTGC